MTTDVSPATVRLADVLTHVRSGTDPLEPWRAALRTQMEQRAGAPVPPHVPAAFVLQWWCEVAATPTAYAASLGPWVLDPSPGGLGFELAPGLQPARVVVDPALASLKVEGVLERRLERARTAYLLLVSEVVAAYAPDVRMGSRQRWGVVDDVWVTALRPPPGPPGPDVGPQPRRVPGGFFYPLPGRRGGAPFPPTGPARPRARGVGHAP